MVVRLTSLIAALALLAALPVAAEARRSKLARFDSCNQLAKYGKRFAGRENAPSGAVEPARPPRANDGGGMPVAAPQEDGVGGSTQDYSTTNVQEDGVDEPDFVKTNGDVVFVASQGTLYAVAARGAPQLLGSIALGDGYDHQLLLHGNRILAVHHGSAKPAASTSQAVQPDIAPYPYYAPKAVLSEIDVSDPAAMKVDKTMVTDGSVAAGRRTGSIVRLVVNAVPEALAYDSARPAKARAAKRKRGARRWLPRAVVRDRRSGKRTKRRLVSCRRVSHTTAYSGMGMLTVLTLDLDKGLEPTDSDALMTDAQTVYASQQRLYVATERWRDYDGSSEPPPTRTAIHAFDVSVPGETDYVASGEIPGHLLSQWAMSERNGVLRVASTDMPPWWGDADSREQSQSFVTTLGEEGTRLVRLGQVGGLGKGERIYAVRFIEDMGYVVTFRQVDPLYTVDVSDPATPKVLGELKVLGYSAYLHPAGDGLLIGVGQDASEEGRTQGAQISLFDVSDPASPQRLHQRVIAPEASTQAEWDHHAFLYWAPSQLAVLPVTIYEPQPEPQQGGPDRPVSSDDYYAPPWMGAIGFGIEANAGITERGRIEHPSGEDDHWLGEIRRSLVVADKLLTVSDLGVAASDLSSFGAGGWVPFDAKG